MTISGATTPGQSEPRSDGNGGVLHISQSSSITETSPSDCLVSYPGHSLEEGLTLLQRSSRWILKPQLTGQTTSIVHSTATKWLMKFRSGCKNFYHQIKSARLKTGDSESIPQTIEQIRWVTLGEYQANSASHGSLKFITFLTSTKTPGVAK